MIVKYIESIKSLIEEGNDELLAQVCMAVGAGNMFLAITGDYETYLNCFNTQLPMETYDILIGKIKAICAADKERDDKKAMFQVVK